LIVLLIVERHRLFPITENVLLSRWFSWSMILPLYLFGVLSGITALTILVMLLTFQALREYAELVHMSRNYRTMLIVMGMTAAPMAALSLEGFYLLAPLLLVVATLQPLLFGRDEGGVQQLAFATLGWSYISWFLAHILLIARQIDGGPGIILVIVTAVGLSDVGAFVVGSLFGKHKMSPRLSPGKTIEGLAGNFIGALAGAVLMAYAVPGPGVVTFIIVLSMLIACGSIWGDLVESAIKREFGVKDAGTWLPGFGGILDRIDSLIIVAPLVYYFLRFTS
jgi:phosphatidate cytidylyltransferase